MNHKNVYNSNFNNNQTRVQNSQYLVKRAQILQFVIQFKIKKEKQKCDWLIKPGKVHVERKQIRQIRHETIFRETFNRLNGWQIENDNDTEF